MRRPRVRASRYLTVLAAASLAAAGLFGYAATLAVPWNITPALDNVADAISDQPARDSGQLLVPPIATHIPTPEPLYAIYMSQCVVGTPSFRNSLISFIESSDLNAVVIDIKDYTGTIAFPTSDPRFAEATLVSCGASDMKDFIKALHEKDIYVIGRIAVFQDPHYTALHPEEAVQSISRPGEPWKDFKGLSFVDVSSKDFWNYIAVLSKESYAIGFDELNYDYIRYPSDGAMADATFVNPHMEETLEGFFSFLHDAVKPTGAVLSADLFGMTTTNTDDLNIGQQLERALPYFDYVSPMVYPSHYPKTFLGLPDPNYDPYLVVNYSMLEAVRRTKAQSTPIQTLSGKSIFIDEVVPAAYDPLTGAVQATSTKKVPTGLYSKEQYSPLVLRPWLQDFDYGKDYLPEDIRAQIKAVQDAGLTSYMFWDPANRYENLKQVLATPQN